MLDNLFLLIALVLVMAMVIAADAALTPAPSHRLRSRRFAAAPPLRPPDK